MSKPPLLIELFCGLGAVSRVFEDQGWRCLGFDIERHVYGPERYPCQLVLQDVLTLHGSQFKDADFIWASPPCQQFSYMAMPWKRGKQIAAALHGEANFPEEYTGSRTVQDLRALFDSCFRIQREASIAAGHHIPMVVENVKGAQPWVGQARANFGSFFLWGDIGMANGNIVVPGAEFGDVLRAPSRSSQKKVDMPSWSGFGEPDYKAVAFNGQAARQNAQKVPGFNFHQFEQTGKSGGSFKSAATKTVGHVNKRDGHDHTRHLTNQRESDGVKIHGSGDEYWRKPLEAKRREATAVKNGGDWFSSGEGMRAQRHANSKSTSRKAASAMIAKIPEPLSRYLARAFNLGRVIDRTPKWSYR